MLAFFVAVAFVAAGVVTPAFLGVAFVAVTVDEVAFFAGFFAARRGTGLAMADVVAEAEPTARTVECRWLLSACEVQAVRSSRASSDSP